MLWGYFLQRKERRDFYEENTGGRLYEFRGSRYSYLQTPTFKEEEGEQT